MTLVLGIDPGANGAFAIYDTDTRRIVDMEDIPIWHQTVGKRKRKRIDMYSMAELFEKYELLGVEIAIMEAVGGRTGQGAAAGFVFGYGVGLIYACAFYTKLVVETIPPATWKRTMNVPGKEKADNSAIIARADELFPLDRAMFRGKQGGLKVDRAEAAMMAKYGAEHLLSLRGLDSVEDYQRMAAERADTGA